jgi:hypothetical protein
VLRFKIGYNVAENQVRPLFEAACELAKRDADTSVEAHSPIAVRVTDAGEWSLYLLYKEFRHLLRTRQLLLALVIQQAEAADISLSTPVLTDSTFTQHLEQKGAADRVQAT